MQAAHQNRANGDSFFTKMDLKVLIYCIEQAEEKATDEAKVLLKDARRAVTKEFAYIHNSQEDLRRVH
jgi:hypothetical protein